MSQLQVTGEAKIRDIQGPVVANSGVITALDGAASQYVRGDGTLADFPSSSGGGSSVSYYLNSSVSQGTIDGNAYRELSKDPIIGTGTDIAISSNGYVANYITDANDPDVVIVPGGNFNCEFYFSVNNNTGSPTTYAELYKYDGSTFTLLGSSSGVPESINQGTTIAPYYFAIPVATATLATTDRLAIRIYVNVDGRTVTLHTENSHLCQVVTTLSKGMVSLNNLTDQSQYLTTGTSGTDFNIVSSGDTHTFNIPSASSSNRGLITTGSQTIAGAKTFSSTATFNTGGVFNNWGISLYDGAGSTALSSSTLTGIYASKSGSITDIVISHNAPYDSILRFSNDVDNFTYTFPDLSGTLALLEGTQTFTAANTFNNSVKNEYGTFIKENQSDAVPSGYKGLFATTNGLEVRNTNTSSGFLNFNNAGNYTYTFPAASGTVALTSNLSSYVPYTGATGAVNLGFYDLTVSGLKIGTGSGGTNNTRVGAISFISNTTGSYNTSLGAATLNANTTGNSNTAIGNSSLQLNTTGSYNTSLGSFSLGGNTTGNYNTGVGYATLAGNTIGTQNTALGSSALNANISGSNNTAIGNVVLQQNTTGDNNTAIGSYASYLNTTGSNNTSIGASALSANTTGEGNTAIGGSSLYSNTTAFYNTAIGFGSLNLNTTGQSNVGVGATSLGVNTTGQYNVAIGRSASNANTTGNYNTALGGQALANVTTGSQNIAIGYNSGGGITTGSQNTIIGTVTGLSSSLANNIILADGGGNIRYQWDGTNNVFGNPISGTSATFSASVVNDDGLKIKFGSASNLTANYLTLSAYGLTTPNRTVLRLGTTASTLSELIFSQTSSYQYTFPDTSGTLALTSDLGAYLPLTGGTLTGDLTINKSSSLNNLTLSSTSVNAISFITSAVAKGEISVSSTYFQLTSYTSGGYLFKNSSSNNILSITDTGAATFSSSVTADNGLYSKFGNAIYAYNSDNTRFGYLQTTADGTVLSSYSSAGEPLLLRAPASTAYIGLSTAGTERMRITSSGQVNIGNNDSAALRFYNAAATYIGGLGTGYWAFGGGYSTSDLGMIAVNNFIVGAGATERMRITSGGNVGIGTSTISEKLDVEGNLDLRNSDTYSTSLTRSIIYRSNTASYGVQPIANIVFATEGDAASSLRFITRNGAADYNERMRITAGGFLKASNNGTYNSATGPFHEIRTSEGSNAIVELTNSASSNPYGISLYFSGADPNNATNYVFGAYSSFSSTWMYRIFSNGSVAARSDIRLKKNIEPTRNGYLKDLCQLEVVKYNWYNNEDNTPKEIGLIAQQVETIFPNLVITDKVIKTREIQQEDGTIIEEKYEDGDTKSIKHSVLPYITIKALQELTTLVKEQQAQIEELKALIAAK